MKEKADEYSQYCYLVNTHPQGCNLERKFIIYIGGDKAVAPYSTDLN